MTKKIYILSAILIILVLAIIALLTIGGRKKVATVPEVQPTPEQITQNENVIVDKTKSFSIVLESNPTTGYSWEPKFDETYIKLVSASFIPYPETSNKVGGGGTQNFEFSALQSGETQITFTYARPWEKDNPAETKIYTIKIL
jgi:inhibitor of cysteine peptidase